MGCFLNIFWSYKNFLLKIYQKTGRPTGNQGCKVLEIIFIRCVGNYLSIAQLKRVMNYNNAY